MSKRIVATVYNTVCTFDYKMRIRYRDENSRWQDIAYVNTGYEYVSFDISKIPAGSKIISVSFNVSPYGSSTFGYSVKIRETGESANSKTVLEYLQRQKQFDALQIIYSAYAKTATYELAGGLWSISDWEPYTGGMQFKDASLTVEYEEPENSTVSYGANGTWQKCKTFYAVNGKWQEVKPQFGANGDWKEVK